MTPLKPSSPTIASTMDAYLDGIKLSRSLATYKTYKNALNQFCAVLESRHLPPAETPIDNLKEDAISWLAVWMKNYSTATERLYLAAVTGFYEYLAAEALTPINLPRIRLLIQQRARRPGIRLPQFPRDAIEHVLEYVKLITNTPTENVVDHLINLRDRAFLVTLADTGLRVHEACGLRRGSLDIHEGKAVIIGKGNKQAVVRFSKRSITAIKQYLQARQGLDGGSHRPLATLPLFARHDKGSGKRISAITPKTGRMIVARRVEEALGKEAVGSITPHSFRHYFVTMVLKGSGNLKLAQELARHSSVAITQRYAHLSDDELDKGYAETIDQNE
jgi:site-specific recombinase XerD